MAAAALLSAATDRAERPIGFQCVPVCNALWKRSCYWFYRYDVKRTRFQDWWTELASLLGALCLVGGDGGNGFGVSGRAADRVLGSDAGTFQLALAEEKWRSHRMIRMNSGRPETMENLPALYSIFQGEVAMVTDYGAFIKIPGCRKQGLVHRTHMSSCRVDKPSEIVDVGDKVWVKLIGREMKNDRIKVSLSMKVVNQGTGKDLDPNNVIIEQEERRRRSFQDYTGQKITLEAVLNTTCKKCGCKGHFAKDCFMQPGGTKYSLIPDEEEEKEEAKGAELEKPDPTRNSSRKRKKEKKKKKHRDKKSSDSDSSDSESDMGKKARRASRDSKAARKKKRKKQHKKKHRE